MVSFSIVTYKHSFSKLLPTLRSILNEDNGLKIYIIDNSPTNELKNSLGAENIEYIFNNSNVGFGSGHNIALNISIQNGFKYHFVINPDIYFDIGTIRKIVKFMDQHPDVGLLMPQVRYPDKSLQHLPKLLPSPFDLVIRRFSLLRRIFFKRFENYELRNFSDCETFSSPIISGCFSCFRIEALKKVGLYDEDFFMYFEDFDISRRMNKYYNTICYSGVHVFHEYERGAQKSTKLFRIFIHSAITYFNKWGWFFDNERKLINKKILNQFD